ncbi:MAG: pantoate--beta-alanine ligase [Myxococcota bacterium]|nr:pantoate--beta-alanine ligase [Myxococcota bacterium]
MRVVATTRELQALAEGWRAEGRRIALVPTMGALHAGHLALVREARRRADRVVVSLFVNPTQFDQRADLLAYPRTGEADREACREAGVDVVFAPSETELYPEGAQTVVEVPGLAAPLCGASRPGHFRGVATVVTKLLVAARPHVAVFGRKDFQQLRVVERLVRDLGFDVEVVGVPTVREPDGLALSSRNVHLGPEARAEALVLPRALDAAEAATRAGERSAEALLALARREVAKAPSARLDYAELRDPEDLAPAPERLCGPTLLALAAFFPGRDGGAVRLIDHRVLPAEAPKEDGT